MCPLQSLPQELLGCKHTTSARWLRGGACEQLCKHMAVQLIEHAGQSTWELV